MTPERRARLAWLHRWVGLVSGWIAFAIFLTGTLSLFDTELTRWMQPETETVPYGTQLSLPAVDRTQQILRDSNQAGAPPSFLLLPDARDPTLRILHYDGHNFVGPILDPRTGEKIPARQTEGGNFFFNFHYTLRIPSPWGARLVACVAFAFSAMVLSGVLLHLKRLMPDYFTLRLKASLPRCLLDLHVLTGSAMLPFHVIITWTGLILTAENALPVIQLGHEVPVQEASTTPVAPQWAPEASLALMLQNAHAQLGASASYVLFDAGKATFYAIRHNSLSANDTSVTFNSQTGRLLNTAPPATYAEEAFFIMDGLHIARSMGPLLRWLWFGGGLASTLMIASGLVYYTARQKKQTSASFQLARRLNLAVMGGLVCSCLSLFILNRLIPTMWCTRNTLEVIGFFSIWACIFFLSMTLSPNKNRTVVCWTIGLAGMAVPVIDWIMVPASAWVTSLHFTVNSLCIVTGLASITSLYFIPSKNSHD
ncbi:PepSY-associated TM helix domain-containing protein [Acetobacter ghanensis]|uniref:PepSY-associated TM helix domain-containing protein n=1 Tax=Acetobacter ghanensis TaxID=431306 RepID=UPI003D347C1F